MKTHIYRDGEKGRAMCETCRGLVDTTFIRRDVPLSDGTDVVKDVLVGVCDTCDSVVSMPHQSAPRVQSVIEKQRKSIETRVPAHLKDMIFLVTSTLNQSEGFEQQVFRYYFHLWSSRGAPAARIRKYRKDPLFKGKADTRLSIKISDADELVSTISKSLDQISNKTELIKAITFTAYEDVVEKPRSRAKSALEAIAAACA